MNTIKDIPGFNNWTTIQVINKGWSIDKKYYIKTIEETELLLRTTDISQYEIKKREYEELKLLSTMDLLISGPVDFGICNDGKSVYLLLTWIDGEDAESILPNLSVTEQYRLGIKAGEFLKQIHKISAPQNISNWEKRFNHKIDVKMANYQACDIRFPGDDRFISYIEDNRHLLDNRPQTLHHGDYHVGNMIITPELELGIIDFNRMDYGDPWEEFNRITFCVETSSVFASGYINGYFNHQVPDVFFRLLALYIANNQLSSIPWAIPFGQEEVKNMLRITKNVSDWYDGFNTFIPNWYTGRFDHAVTNNM